MSENASDPVRVLVVDDNVDAAETSTLLFQIWNCTVETAYGGEEAIRIARDFRPDLVLLDIRMPGLDGFSVARELRSPPGLPPLIVAVSGDTKPKHLEAETAFDDYIIKPASMEELKRILARVAARRQPRPEERPTE